MTSADRNKGGFTLVELLVVLGIAALLVSLSGPALQSLMGAGTINRNISDLSGVLESARAYAMANHTYVRVGLGQPPAGTLNPSVAVIVLYSADGQLDSATKANMTDPTLWPQVRPPVILNSLVPNDNLNGLTPSTSSDIEPSQNDIASASSPLSFSSPPTVAGYAFSSFIQFEPSGEARVITTQLARSIKIAMDKPNQAGRNPFILRLSGINGTIVVIRKEDM